MNPTPLHVAALTAFSLGLGAPCSAQDLPAAQQEELLRETAVDAYVFAFPLVLMEITRQVGTNVAEPAGIAAPMNQFAHARTFPDHTFRDVVRPNADTLYSCAWYDVGAEPMVLTVPDGIERYFMLPMLDMWTEVFACPGTRTTAARGGQYAIVGPDWRGSLPAGVQPLRSPTNIGWIIGRTRTDGPADYERVHAIQDQLRLQPLSKLGTVYTPPKGKVDPTIDMKTPPLDQVREMPVERFFALFARVLADNPPHQVDWSMMARLERLGITPGDNLEFAALRPAVQAALRAAPETAVQRILDRTRIAGVQRNRWIIGVDGMGSYGAAYLQRAYIAYIGLGANVPADAVYPMTVQDETGEPYHGSNRYVVHFDKDQLPPVRGFWSLTLYDETLAFAANPIGRYALGDRDALRFNPDGSLDLYIQHDSPGKVRESNWLPAPDGPFDLVLRLYWPQSQVLTLDWVPPPVLRVEM